MVAPPLPWPAIVVSPVASTLKVDIPPALASMKGKPFVSVAVKASIAFVNVPAVFESAPRHDCSSTSTDLQSAGCDGSPTGCVHREYGRGRRPRLGINKRETGGISVRGGHGEHRLIEGAGRVRERQRIGRGPGIGNGGTTAALARDRGQPGRGHFEHGRSARLAVDDRVELVRGRCTHGQQRACESRTGRIGQNECTGRVGGFVGNDRSTAALAGNCCQPGSVHREYGRGRRPRLGINKRETGGISVRGGHGEHRLIEGAGRVRERQRIGRGPGIGNGGTTAALARDRGQPGRGHFEHGRSARLAVDDRVDLSEAVALMDSSEPVNPEPAVLDKTSVLVASAALSEMIAPPLPWPAIVVNRIRPPVRGGHGEHRLIEGAGRVRERQRIGRGPGIGNGGTTAALARDRGQPGRGHFEHGRSARLAVDDRVELVRGRCTHGQQRACESRTGRIGQNECTGRVGGFVGNDRSTAALAGNCCQPGSVHREYGRGRRPRLGINKRETGGISVRGGHGEHRLIEGAGRVRERQRIGRGPGIGNGGTTAALARDRGQPGRGHFEHGRSARLAVDDRVELVRGRCTHGQQRACESRTGRIGQNECTGRVGGFVGNDRSTAALAGNCCQPGSVHREYGRGRRPRLGINKRETGGISVRGGHGEHRLIEGAGRVRERQRIGRGPGIGNGGTTAALARDRGQPGRGHFEHGRSARLAVDDRVELVRGRCTHGQQRACESRTGRIGQNECTGRVGGFVGNDRSTAALAGNCCQPGSVHREYGRGRRPRLGINKRETGGISVRGGHGEHRLIEGAGRVRERQRIGRGPGIGNGGTTAALARDRACRGRCTHGQQRACESRTGRIGQNECTGRVGGFVGNDRSTAALAGNCCQPGSVHREYGRGRRPRLGINKRETGGISVRGGHGEHRLIEGAGRVRERQRIGRGPGIGNGGTTAALARDRGQPGRGHFEHGRSARLAVDDRVELVRGRCTHGQQRACESRTGRIGQNECTGRVGGFVGNDRSTAALAGNCCQPGSVHREYGRGRRPRLGINKRETGGISVRGGHGEHRLIEGAGRVRERQRIGRGPGIGNGGTTAALARDRGQPGRGHFEHGRSARLAVDDRVELVRGRCTHGQQRACESRTGRIGQNECTGRVGGFVGNDRSTAALAGNCCQPGSVHREYGRGRRPALASITRNRWHHVRGGHGEHR
ncbi:hypothetical protein GQ600_22072 [Phytophthora cactorum]|nr:hypothetical protein GQ600_22072 [Phytophthora cactorum]